MAEFRHVTNETKELFYKVLENTGIPNWVEFALLANDDLKEIYQVKKLSDLFEFLSEGTNIAIVLNEEIFEQLPLDLQELVFIEALGGVVVDENDRLKIEAFDFTTYTGFLAKYGNEEVIRFKESIKSLYDAKAQKEEEEKAAKKAKRKKKATISSGIDLLPDGLTATSEYSLEEDK